jgi:hypothetical protein
MLDQEKYNKGITRRARKIKDDLKTSLGTLNIGQTGDLLAALNKIKYKRLFGEIEGIGFTVTKGGVMTMYGVGKGVPVDSAKTNGDKIGRSKKPWFNPIIDKHIPNMANYIASQKADSLLNAIKLK